MTSPSSVVQARVGKSKRRGDAMKKSRKFVVMDGTRTVLMVVSCFTWISGTSVLSISILSLFNPSVLKPDYLVWACLGAFTALASVWVAWYIANKQSALLNVYAGLLALIVLLQLGIGATVYTYRRDWMQGLEHYLNKTSSAHDQKNITTYIDMAQPSFTCCGLINPEHWFSIFPTIIVPWTCCKDSESPAGESQNKQHSPVYQLHTDGCSAFYSMATGITFGILFFSIINVLCATQIGINLHEREQSSLNKKDEQTA